MRTSRILSLSTFTVGVGVIVATALTRSGFVGATIALGWLWTALVLEELHDVLPEDFHYSLAEGRKYVSLKLAVSVLYAGVVSLAAISSWLTFGWAEGAFRPVLVVIGGLSLLLQYCIVTHVLSAVETLESGENREASIGVVLLNVLLPPLFVVFTHQRARRAMRRLGMPD